MWLIDTDIFINISRGKHNKKLLQWDSTECVSDVTYMEFVQGCRDQAELTCWKKVVQNFTLIPISEEISHRARYLMDSFSLSHGLTLADALIASTCLAQEFTLVTGNKKHFSFIPGLKAKFVK